jgi:hypothetical protein
MSTGVTGIWPQDSCGHSYCGECACSAPDAISSHEEDCTVRSGMQEARDAGRPETDMAAVDEAVNEYFDNQRMWEQ